MIYAAKLCRIAKAAIVHLRRPSRSALRCAMSRSTCQLRRDGSDCRSSGTLHLRVTAGKRGALLYGEVAGLASPTKKLYVSFSNRPFGVKRFQTIHRCNVDVAHGLVLLFGIDARVLPAWDSRTRRNNLLGGLAVNRTAGPSRHADSPHPSSREGHLSTARWISIFSYRV